MSREELETWMSRWRLRGANALFAIKALPKKGRPITEPSPEQVAALAARATDLTPVDLTDLSQRYGSIFKLFEQCGKAHRELAGLQQQLAGLQQQIEAKRTELREVQAAVAKEQANHDRIQRGLADLKARFSAPIGSK
jgi:septal ring factor EnvC (AmiA/AmiB activator)